MYAVIFEVEVKPEGRDEYLAIAAKLREQLAAQKGFISIERFQSLAEDSKMLSISYWDDLDTIQNWKANLDHQAGQARGRAALFRDYRIRVAKVEKDYTLETSTFSNA